MARLGIRSRLLRWGLLGAAGWAYRRWQRRRHAALAQPVPPPAI
ncbi:MAG: hypothetical protein AB7H43_03290 [Acidimicrobiia bacterium]